MTQPELWAATAAIIFVSAAAQAMTGFGFAVLAVPLLVLVWPPGDAIAISMMLSTLCVLMMWPQVRRDERLPGVGKMFAAALLGLPLGVWLLRHLDLHTMRAVIGAVALMTVVIFGIGMFRRDAQRVSGKPGTALALLTGAAAGLLTGSLSMPGPAVVVLLTTQRAPKAVYRATLTAFAVLIYPVALAVFAFSGMISRATTVQAIMQVPVLVFGIRIGNRLHHGVSERGFALLSLALLGGTGAVCLFGR